MEEETELEMKELTEYRALTLNFVINILQQF